MTGPLQGIRVADLTRGIAGSHATKLLADFGAAVTKLEPPEGDPLRHWGSFKDDVPNLAMRLGMMGVFLGVAWFCLVTIGLRRSPKASGLVLLGSFVVLFAGAVMQ